MPNSSKTDRDVAVIVPCYNVEDCLQRALDSAFDQTYADFHVYAVDDGSTDDTARILENNAHRCSFNSQPHAGPAAARNCALRMSESPFVAFLDADDEWLPRKLERQVELLKQDPTLGLVCSLCLLSESGMESHDMLAGTGIPTTGKLFEHLVRNCFVFTPTVVVRRRCLEEVGLFNESLAVSEDFNLWLRIAARWKIALLPEVLAITHKRTGSLSARVSPEERLKNGITALEHVQSSCPGLSASESHALRDALADRHYFHGSFLLSAGAKGRSRRSLASALRLRHTHWRAFAKLGLSFLPARAFQSIAGLKAKLAYRPLSKDSSQFAPRDASSI